MPLRTRSAASGPGTRSRVEYRYRTDFGTDGFLAAYYCVPPDSYRSSVITDEQAKYEGGRPKMCTHEKTVTQFWGIEMPPVCEPLGSFAEMVLPTLPVRRNGRTLKVLPFGYGLDSVADFRNQVDITPLVPDATAIYSSLAAKLANQVVPKLALPNFLLELKDLRRLPSVITGLHRALSTGFRSFRTLYRAITHPDRASALRRRAWLRSRDRRSFGDWWLEVQFGISPLLGDIQSFFDSVSTLDERVNRLAEINHHEVPVIRRASRSFSATMPYVENFRSAPSAIVGRIGASASYNCRIIYAVGGLIRYDLTGLDDVNKRLLAHLVDLGFNKPFSVAWEAIPFSFLVDYAVNLGSVLSDFEDRFLGSGDPFQGTHTLRNTFTQQTMSEYAAFTGELSSVGGTFNVSDTYMSTRRVTFARSPGLPSPSGLRFTTSLTADQLINIFALKGATRSSG